MAEAAARAIVDRLEAAGYQGWFAGGAVRDRLLGIPAQDFDVATDALPEAVMRLFPRHTAVGARFGVVLVQEEGSAIEVATFRTDQSYADGRHPEAVAYGTDPRVDVERRDFTINGLLLRPRDGLILDCVGGREDLAAGLVRAIGNPERRFAEDHLRMLRGVRFAARLGFALEAATMASIERHAARLADISPERIRDELVKMLTEGHARRAFELLEATGLLGVVLPEVAAMRGVAQPPQYHPEGDVWTHTLLMLAGLPAGCAPALALGVLLHDVGKPPTFRHAPDRIRFDRHAAIGARMTERIAGRLRLSNETSDRVVALVEQHMQFAELPHMRESTRLRFLRRPGLEQHLDLHRLDCLASHGDLTLYDMAQAKLAATPPEALRPARLLNGDDLIRLGYSPGPRFRAVLEAIEDGQLEGRLQTRADAEAFARMQMEADQ